MTISAVPVSQQFLACPLMRLHFRSIFIKVILELDYPPCFVATNECVHEARLSALLFRNRNRTYAWPHCTLMKTFFSKELAIKYGPALSRLFSSLVMRDFASRGQSRLASDIVRESGEQVLPEVSISLGEWFNVVFASLFRHYRNEYVYKNMIANKILLGRHSLNTSTMITEFRTADCKADTVILNGTSNVYEIKSEFDTLTRLRRQLSAYRQIFDRVHVLTSASQLDSVFTELSDDIGVLVLTDRHTIRVIREPVSHKTRVNPAVIFDSLRRSEYVQILNGCFGRAPELPNTQMYQACKELFCRLSPAVAHDEMVKVLKKRGCNPHQKRFIDSVPFSLKAASVACKLSKTEKASFLTVLQQEARSCLLA